MQTSQLGRSRSHPHGRWLLTQLGRGGDSACPLPACTLTPWEETDEKTELFWLVTERKLSQHDRSHIFSQTPPQSPPWGAESYASGGREGTGRPGAAGALPLPPQLRLTLESADAEPGGLSRGPAITVSFASGVWQGSRAAHGAPG